MIDHKKNVTYTFRTSEEKAELEMDVIVAEGNADDETVPSESK